MLLLLLYILFIVIIITAIIMRFASSQFVLSILYQISASSHSSEMQHLSENICCSQQGGHLGTYIRYTYRYSCHFAKYYYYYHYYWYNKPMVCCTNNLILASCTFMHCMMSVKSRQTLIIYYNCVKNLFFMTFLIATYNNYPSNRMY